MQKKQAVNDPFDRPQLAVEKSHLFAGCGVGSFPTKMTAFNRYGRFVFMFTSPSLAGCGGEARVTTKRLYFSTGDSVLLQRQLLHAVAVCCFISQVAEDAAHSREGGGDADDGGIREFEYPEEPVVKLNPTQHVLYCCPSKDPTEQNCGKYARFCWCC